MFLPKSWKKAVEMMEVQHTHDLSNEGRQLWWDNLLGDKHEIKLSVSTRNDTVAKTGWLSHCVGYCCWKKRLAENTHHHHQLAFHSSIPWSTRHNDYIPIPSGSQGFIGQQKHVKKLFCSPAPRVFTILSYAQFIQNIYIVYFIFTLFLSIL